MVVAVGAPPREGDGKGQAEFAARAGAHPLLRRDLVCGEGAREPVRALVDDRHVARLTTPRMGRHPSRSGHDCAGAGRGLGLGAGRAGLAGRVSVHGVVISRLTDRADRPRSGVGRSGTVRLRVPALARMRAGRVAARRGGGEGYAAVQTDAERLVVYEAPQRGPDGPLVEPGLLGDVRDQVKHQRLVVRPRETRRARPPRSGRGRLARPSAAAEPGRVRRRS